jgi:hypothetical protein
MLLSSKGLSPLHRGCIQDGEATVSSSVEHACRRLLLRLNKEKSMRVVVRSGDIRFVQADAMIATINPNSVNTGITNWSDLVDLAGATQLPDGHTLITRGNEMPSISFGHVLVIIDTLLKPLSQIVTVGLTAANEAQFETVTLPPVRMQAFGWGDKRRREAAFEIAQGVRDYTAKNPASRIRLATFVVYGSPQIERLLSDALNLQP